MMCSSSWMCSREDELFPEEDEMPMLESNVLEELFSSVISTSGIDVVSNIFDGVCLILDSFCNTIDRSVREVFDSLNNYCETINLKPTNLAVLTICFFCSHTQCRIFLYSAHRFKQVSIGLIINLFLRLVSDLSTGKH